MIDLYLLAHVKQAIDHYTQAGFGDDAVLWARVVEDGPIAGGGARPLLGFDGYSTLDKLHELAPDATGHESAYTLGELRKACTGFEAAHYPDSSIIWANVGLDGPVDARGARPLRKLVAFASLDALRHCVPGVADYV